MALVQTRYTFDEWLDSPQNTMLSELVDGIPVERMGTSSDHGRVVRTLQHRLERAEEAGYGSVHVGPETVLLDATGPRRNAREPDVFFLSQTRDALDTGRAIEGVPDLVIEVLSTGNRGDVLPGGGKWRDYERFGVPTYHIVDPSARIVTQYMHQGHRFGPARVLTTEDLLSSSLFPGITLPVADLFRNLRTPQR